MTTLILIFKSERDADKVAEAVNDLREGKRVHDGLLRDRLSRTVSATLSRPEDNAPEIPPHTPSVSSAEDLLTLIAQLHDAHDANFIASIPWPEIDALELALLQARRRKVPAHTPQVKSFWVSWYHAGQSFEIRLPWWITGECGDGRETICAAVQGYTEADVKEIILSAHDNPAEARKTIEWRFCNQQADDWSPFNDRFARKDWMRWPPEYPK